jgi:hypothetical protein
MATRHIHNVAVCIDDELVGRTVELVIPAFLFAGTEMPCVSHCYVTDRIGELEECRTVLVEHTFQRGLIPGVEFVDRSSDTRDFYLVCAVRYNKALSPVDREYVALVIPLRAQRLPALINDFNFRRRFRRKFDLNVRVVTIADGDRAEL